MTTSCALVETSKELPALMVNTQQMVPLVAPALPDNSARQALPRSTAQLVMNRLEVYHLAVSAHLVKSLLVALLLLMQQMANGLSMVRLPNLTVLPDTTAPLVSLLAAKTVKFALRAPQPLPPLLRELSVMRLISSMRSPALPVMSAQHLRRELRSLLVSTPSKAMMALRPPTVLMVTRAQPVRLVLTNQLARPVLTTTPVPLLTAASCARLALTATKVWRLPASPVSTVMLIHRPSSTSSALWVPTRWQAPTTWNALNATAVTRVSNVV